MLCQFSQHLTHESDGLIFQASKVRFADQSGTGCRPVRPPSVVVQQPSLEASCDSPKPSPQLSPQLSLQLSP
eukprot:644599-Pyramimonas_sp.AAC.2